VKTLEFSTLHGFPIISIMRNLLSHDAIDQAPIIGQELAI
jgi:hypothetical protein